MGRRSNIGETHDFYCVACGNKGLPIFRPHSLQRSKFHRKKLYCFHCKAEVNHVECKNEKDIRKFKHDFAAGVYEDEAKESLSYCRNSCFGQK